MGVLPWALGSLGEGATVALGTPPGLLASEPEALARPGLLWGWNHSHLRLWLSLSAWLQSAGRREAGSAHVSTPIM